jgi:serine protease inhibitor
VGIEITAMPTYDRFIVDRPFFFVIRDDHSGSILFMGKITNPLQSTPPYELPSNLVVFAPRVHEA